MATQYGMNVYRDFHAQIADRAAHLKSSFESGPYDGYDPDDACAQTQGYIEFLQDQKEKAKELVDILEKYTHSAEVEISDLS